VSAEVELRMLEGSEFQTVGAAMLKPHEAKVVRTRGTDKRNVSHSLKSTKKSIKPLYPRNSVAIESQCTTSY